MLVTFIELTAVLVVWWSNGQHTVSTHTLNDCYAIEAAVNELEGSDPSYVDQLHIPDDFVTANSALCFDPFPPESEHATTEPPNP